MTLALTAAGILLIVAAIFDILKTLFDLEDQGPLTNALSWAVWRFLKAAPGPLIRYAGPTAYALVLFCWALLLLTGWALLYQPHLPDDFAFAGEIGVHSRTGFVTAFYISLTTLGTLGYGDITPTTTWLRIIGPAQSLVGFLLLSAAITWVLAIYQDIETRRSLAHETTLLTDALDRADMGLGDLKPETAEKVLDEVVSRIVLVSGSLSQFPITYFFRISDERQSFAVMSLFLLEISEDLQHEDLPVEVRLRAWMLEQALDHLAEALVGKFIDIDPEAGTREILRAYARDHQHSVTEPGEDINEEEQEV